ncbi:hypothetical protein RFI_21555, partial [Reticulomyxa filosa]
KHHMDTNELIEMFLSFGSTAIIAVVVYWCEMYFLSILSSVTYVVLSGTSGLIVIAFSAVMMSYTFVTVSWIGYPLALFAIVWYAFEKVRHHKLVRAQILLQAKPKRSSSVPPPFRHDAYRTIDNSLPHSATAATSREHTPSHHHPKKLSQQQQQQHDVLQQAAINPMNQNDSYVNTGQDVYLDFSGDPARSSFITSERL